MMHFVHVLLITIFWFYIFLFLLAPIALKMRFRLRAKIKVSAIQVKDLPEAARAYLEGRVAEFGKWNFELVSYVNLGNVTPPVGAYMALLSNSFTAEWADATFIVSPVRRYGYFEFITRCSEQLQIDTNTAPSVPVFFSVPEHPTFRFPQIDDVFKLYRIHRMLVTEIARGALPLLPSTGEELAELERRLERYGAWQQKHGFMSLDAAGENYRLTWKGAILGAWRSIWPISMFRAWRRWMENRAILNRVGASG